MKNSKTSIIPAGGVGDSIESKMTSASSIVNMRWNQDNQSWINDRAFQSWWKFPSSLAWDTTPAPLITGDIFLGSKVDSHYFWKKNTGEAYIFIEQGGVLYVQYGNKGQGSNYSGFSYFFDDTVVISTGRQKTSSQYIPYGDRLLILNGFDPPIWLKSPTSFREFGFTLPTPRPEVNPVQPSYTQNKPLETGTGAPYFYLSSINGLGDTTGKTNNYFWKLSYITDTGSESPLSNYENQSWIVDQDATYSEFKFGMVMQLPVCPKGTVARRLYRTKNCLDNQENYFFIKEIEENGSTFYVDYLSDTHLITLSPSTIDSSIIQTDYKYGEAWDGRIWLGKQKKLIYSDRGLPEQFNATNFFDLGNTIGGNITAIKAYYNNLVVFRETAINIVRFSQNGYSFSTISTSIGTVSSRAITTIPRLGLTFVNEEGVWVLTGGLDGGSTIKIEKISKEIDLEWHSANKSALGSVIAAYSEAEKELWIHYPYGYSKTPNKGVVLHLERGGLSWSFRKAIKEINNNLFMFSSLAVDFAGRFVFGSVPNWSTSWDTASNTTNLFGPLHVWCASTYQCQTATLSSKVDGIYTYTIANVEKIASEWVSSWFEWQNGSLQIFAVELDMIAQGDTGVVVEWTKDFQLDFEVQTKQLQADGKLLFTPKEPPVTVDGTVPYSSITKNPFKVNKSRIYNQRKLRLRFDVATMMCDNFKFILRPSTNEVFEIVGFKIDHKATEMPRINQSIRLKRGQAR